MPAPVMVSLYSLSSIRGGAGSFFLTRGNGPGLSANTSLGCLRAGHQRNARIKLQLGLRVH